MIPLRSDVTTLVTSLLGDTQVSGGAFFTAAFQAPHLNSAYQELFGKLDNIGGERVQREGYFLLPAYTGILYPSVAGLNNFGMPIEIKERGTATGYAISAATPNATAGTCALTVAAMPADVVTGKLVEVYGVGGVSDDINDQWMITVNSSTSIVLNGCAATGTYTSGGKVIYSTEQWSDALTQMDTTNQFPNTAGAALQIFCYQRGVIRFPAAGTARELRIRYQLSSSLPVISSPVAGDSMGVDDSLNFLAYRTAQLCAGSKGNPREGKLTQQADYFMAILLQKATREQQVSENATPAAFRGRRNIRIGVW